MDMWSAHTLQVNELMRRVQQQRETESAALQQDRSASDERWLTLLRGRALGSILTSLVGVSESRGQLAVLRRWAAAVEHLRWQKTDGHGRRLGALQLCLQDGGRAELLKVGCHHVQHRTLLTTCGWPGPLHDCAPAWSGAHSTSTASSQRRPQRTGVARRA